jgi:phage I-like protein
MAGGTYQHYWFGELIFDSILFDQMVGNFNEGVILRQIALDVDHDMTMAYGWIESLRRRGEDQDATLHATIRWTSPGMDLINGELYKYTSAEMGFDWEDNKGDKHGPTLLGTALTNRPYITGMEELTLCANEFTEYFGHSETVAGSPPETTEASQAMAFDISTNSPTIADSTNPHINSGTHIHQAPEGNAPMLLSENVITALMVNAKDDETPEQVEATFMASMRTELTPPDGPAIDDVALAAAIEKVFTANTDAPTPEPVVETVVEPVEPVIEPAVLLTEGETAEVIALNATVVQMQADMTALTDQNALLMADRDDQRAMLLLNEARDTGKTTPAMEAAFLGDLARGDAAKFRSVVAALPEPKVVPTAVASGLEGDNHDIGMTTGDAEVAFMARVNEVATEKSIEFGAAYIEVKGGKLDEADRGLYHAYADQAGLGVAQRRKEVRMAADTLRREGALLNR